MINGVKSSINPICEKYQIEKQAFNNKFAKEVLRPDNERQRQKFVFNSSVAVFLISFSILNRNYFRFSLRNAGLTYAALSYMIYPQNINPF